ncbi:dynamin family protein [Nocardioides pantholopis]|uniref:dynamin family protein n=1 Tax=Nocardioides pantholopis TaxID=2483798 RepID=UPI001F14F803|nr:dynamin family protein [Nocardioides pantholopis]
MTPTLGASSSDGAQMLTALVRLHGALQRTTLPLDTPAADEQRAALRDVVDQLEDYIIPRVTTLEAPMLVVVGGSTGAGKSTLVNSLVGRRVTQPGVLRPTTKSPVLVHNPADRTWFGQDRLLPDLRRVDHETTDQDALQLIASDTVPAGIALLDAPDVDSVDERNRELAAQLLTAADLWLFVTSAARYADQVPWEYLREAADRSTAVAVVLDRTAPDAVQTVSTHLARMLASRGLKDSPLFIVHEGTVTPEGLLPAAHVEDIRLWLESLAHDGGARSEVVRQTLEGTVRALTLRVHPLADAAAEQAAARTRLQGAAETAYDEAAAALLSGATDGSLVSGELLTRWQEFVGTGELLRSLEDKVGWLRDRVVNAVKGKPQQAERVALTVEAALEGAVLEHGARAAEAAAAQWRERPEGAAALSLAEERGSGPLGRVSGGLSRQAEDAVRAWQQDVAELVRLAGADKRTTARFLVYGVPGLSVALSVVALDEADGDATAAGRRLLEAVFGLDTAPALVQRARDALEFRLADLLAGERRRWDAFLDGLGIEEEAANDLRQAARRVDDVRFAAARRTGEVSPDAHTP